MPVDIIDDKTYSYLILQLPKECLQLLIAKVMIEKGSKNDVKFHGLKRCREYIHGLQFNFRILAEVCPGCVDNVWIGINTY